MASIGERIIEIKKEIPATTQLVAVSKYFPADAIAEAYKAGHRIFGESRAQELKEKYALLPKDIEWHFIGHLQINKVKYIAPFVSLIHGVDSFKLLQEIDKQAAKHQRIIDCLLQLHVACEETKFGYSPEECLEMLSQKEWKKLAHIKIRGVMCMASNVDNETQIAQEFHTAYTFFQEAKEQFFQADKDFNICSWGMSDDYHIAIQEGSNMIRIGSKIFKS